MQSGTQLIVQLENKKKVYSLLDYLEVFFIEIKIESLKVISVLFHK